MDAVLHINKLCIGRESELISDISCELLPGKMVLLSGVNGSGKSTFLKTIAGILNPLSGSISILNKAADSIDRMEKAALIGYAGTERIYEDYITIDDMVRFGRYPYSENNEDSHYKVLLAMQKMGVFELRSKFLDKVSDGEWQKANVARVLAQDTPIILLDEPSAFLDYPSRKKLFSDLQTICRDEQKSVIVSTHDIEIAEKYADVFWHIHQNRIHCTFESPKW